MQSKKNHVQKAHTWCDFLKRLLSRVQVQLLSIDSVRVKVESWSTSVPWCLKTHESQTLVLLAHRKQTKHMCSPPAQPVIWFSIICVTPSAQKFCAGQKKVSRHDKQAKTDLTIQFARKRWLRNRLPSANPLEHG